MSRNRLLHLLNLGVLFLLLALLLLLQDDHEKLFLVASFSILGYALFSVFIIDKAKRDSKEVQRQQFELEIAQSIAKIGNWTFEPAKGKFEWCDELYKIFGIEKKDLSLEEFYSFIDPDDLQAVKEQFENIISDGHPTQLVYKITSSEGTQKYIEQHSSVVSDVLGRTLISCGTMEDVSEHHSHELKLQKTIDEFREKLIRLNEQKYALDSHFIVSIADEKGFISYVNDKFVEITGYSRDELIGSTHSIINSKYHDSSFWKKMYATIYSGKIWSNEIRNRKKDGSFVWFQTSIIPFVKDNGGIKDFIVIRSDVTERISHEQTIRERDIQLMQQTRLAQMGEMVAMIAHQWRQPLSAISAVVIRMKMLLEFDLGNLSNEKDQEKFVQQLDENLQEIEFFIATLSGTIDDFRNYFKPDKKKEATLISQTLRKTLHILSSSLQSSEIKIVENYKSTKEVTLYENEIIQVLLNIIKNAEDNAIEKKIKEPLVLIETDDLDDGVQVRISDNGGGIPNEIIDRIFEPYFSTKSEKNGTGLGLYMCKTIVEEHHHGKLSVENTEDGCCFTLVFKDLKDL